MSEVTQSSRVAGGGAGDIPERLVWVACVGALLALVAAEDGPRTGLLAGLAGMAVLATRTRFAGYAAGGVVALATFVIVTGRGVSG